jgi:hypothetical protein
MSSYTTPAKGLLSGLGRRPDVAAFGKGRAMGGAAENGMMAAQKMQEMAVDSSNSESQRNQRQAQNNAGRLGNEAQERVAGANLSTRKGAFDIGMNYNYANLMKQRQTSLRQALLNSVSRDF